jgi:hypothetical protein
VLLAAASRVEQPPDFRCAGCAGRGSTKLTRGLVRVPALYVVNLARAQWDRHGESSHRP